MRVISLWQPWATLVVMGAKRFETRSFSTSYRGPLAIHATAKMPEEGRALLNKWPFVDYLKGQILPLGKIIGTVEVVGCQTSESWLQHASQFEDGAAERWAEEYQFGDYRADRFAWELKNPLQLFSPIAAKGMQGFWKHNLELDKCLLTHSEEIQCPNCYHVQHANVEHTVPFWSYVHECSTCKYIITESEWRSLRHPTPKQTVK